MEMSRNLYEALSKSLSDKIGEDDLLRDDYSGRYMYGRRCLAMTCEIPEFYAELYRLKDDEDYASEVDDFFENELELCMDSLGLGSIFYFPDVSVEEEEEEGD